MNQRDPDHFTLQVRVEITKCGPNGEYLGGNRLTVDEDLQLEARSFLEVATVLGRFHDLGERIRKEAERHDHVDEPVSMADGDYTRSAIEPGAVILMPATVTALRALLAAGDVGAAAAGLAESLG